MKRKKVAQTLFAELDAMDGFEFLGIAVKFLREEHGSVQVAHGSDSDRVEKLTKMIELGGEPFGIIGLQKDGQTCFCEPLPGHEDDVDVALLRFTTEIHVAHWTNQWQKFPLLRQGADDLVN